MIQVGGEYGLVVTQVLLVRCPSTARISLCPLIEIRPSPVSREQMTDRVKCDWGEVCCHQQVGTKSASARSRNSSRYCG